MTYLPIYCTFYKPTVNESYYSAAVLINRQTVEYFMTLKISSSQVFTQHNTWMDPTHDQLCYHHQDH